MRFEALRIDGPWLIQPDLLEDERGWFARTFCSEEFLARGLHVPFVQSNISWNRLRGTLRGLHYQRPPLEEVKLVRCTKGAVYDVIVDLRPKSQSFRQWTAVELTAENRVSVYVPAGFAHGFQSLEDDTEVLYQMGAPYAPELAAGVRWNDSAFGIAWPISSPILSPRDRDYPDFHP